MHIIQTVSEHSCRFLMNFFDDIGANIDLPQFYNKTMVLDNNNSDHDDLLLGSELVLFCFRWGRDSDPLVRGYIRFRSDRRFKARRDRNRFNGSYWVSRALVRFGRAERRPESGSGSGTPQSSRSASVRFAPGKNSPEVRELRAGILPSTWRNRLASARTANNRGAEDDWQGSSQ